ncbi:MAG: prepilin-type N-terminal cleavage/methylation domain-containing protein [Candidatus Gracilibacteria bacterium]|nr:prepilin-type N-terminal cleavage/methylation domain-containing protein [Candidatus Gracilibacteria bacterium]
MKNKNGYTLIELIVVISIISIVSVAGINGFYDVFSKNREISTLNNVNNTINTINLNIGKTISDYELVFNKNSGFYYYTTNKLGKTKLLNLDFDSNEYKISTNQTQGVLYLNKYFENKLVNNLFYSSDSENILNLNNGFGKYSLKSNIDGEVLNNYEIIPFGDEENNYNLFQIYHNNEELESLKVLNLLGGRKIFLSDSQTLNLDIELEFINTKTEKLFKIKLN